MRTSLKVLLADLVLLIAFFLVFVDVQWRTGYAASGLGYSQVTSYSLFTKVFSLAGKSSSLVSPPTLDWLQVLGVVLATVNLWYAYDSFRSRLEESTRIRQSAPSA